MAKTLFDHIKAITQFQDPNYFDKLEEGDLKTWSNYMIHRFLSMNSDWITTIADLQPYTERLKPEQLYLTLIGIIPQIFLAVSIGSGLDKVIDQNSEIPSITDIIFLPEIYFPNIGFFILVLLTIFLKRLFYRN